MSYFYILNTSFFITFLLNFLKLKNIDKYRVF